MPIRVIHLPVEIQRDLRLAESKNHHHRKSGLVSLTKRIIREGVASNARIWSEVNNAFMRALEDPHPHVRLAALDFLRTPSGFVHLGNKLCGLVQDKKLGRAETEKALSIAFERMEEAELRLKEAEGSGSALADVIRKHSLNVQYNVERFAWTAFFEAYEVNDLALMQKADPILRSLGGRDVSRKLCMLLGRAIGSIAERIMLKQEPLSKEKRPCVLHLIDLVEKRKMPEEFDKEALLKPAKQKLRELERHQK